MGVCVPPPRKIGSWGGCLICSCLWWVLSLLLVAVKQRDDGPSGGRGDDVAGGVAGRCGWVLLMNVNVLLLLGMKVSSGEAATVAVLAESARGIADAAL